MRYSKHVIFLVLAMITMIACRHQSVVEPEIEIRVQQSKNDLTFDFFITERRWFRSGKTTMGIDNVTIMDEDGKVLWDIRSRDVRSEVSQIKYGSVPDEFEQILPVNVQAPHLKVGSKYTIYAFAGGFGQSTFIYGKGNIPGA
jgi:hypothetical protein